MNSKRVLFISPDGSWAAEAAGLMMSQGLEVDTASNGKEAQLKAYKTPFHYIFLDLETTDHRAVEVLKYLRTANTGAKVFVIGASEARVIELIEDPKNLVKMGAHKVIYDASPKTLYSHIQELGQLKKFADLKEVESTGQDSTESNITDTEFTRVRINDFFEDSIAALDYYLRLGSNRYIKIIHRGEMTSNQQLKKYADNGAEWLYFLTKDRALYISYQNELAKRSLENSVDGTKAIKAMKSATDKYIEEIHTVGIQPSLIEEGKAICQNMYMAAKKDKNLKDLLGKFEDFNPEEFSHAFLVAFFSTVICKGLDWVGPKTVDTLALGALFHDIGFLQLPDEIRDTPIMALSPQQLLIHNSHPQIGVATLKTIPGLTSGVIEIVLQHHEYINGNGFPGGLTGSRIYPLAKVVGLADGFTDFLKERGLNPKEALKEFISIKEIVTNYDQDLVRNLVRGMVGGEKK